MSIQPDVIDRLILDIHRAPLDEALWPGILKTLHATVGAEKAMLFSVPQGTCKEFWNVGSSMEPEIARDYAREFVAEDPWAMATRRMSTSLVGCVLCGEELINHSKFLRTRFHNEFMRLYGIDRLGVVVLQDAPYRGANVGASLSLYRRSGAGAYGEDELKLLRRLAPHLVLALNTYWRISSLSIVNAAMRETLDAVNAALFLVDSDGRVVFENIAARSVLRGGECLDIVDGRLSPSRSVREQKVCCEVLQGLPVGRGASVRLTVGPQSRTVILSTAPIPSTSSAFLPWRSAVGLVWIVPFEQKASATKRVASLFSLTPAEEDVLRRLCAGNTLANAAEALGISIHTARNQLKSVQHKTGWRTQSELIRMVTHLSSVEPDNFKA